MASHPNSTPRSSPPFHPRGVRQSASPSAIEKGRRSCYLGVTGGFLFLTGVTLVHLSPAVEAEQAFKLTGLFFGIGGMFATLFGTIGALTGIPPRGWLAANFFCLGMIFMIVFMLLISIVRLML